MAPNNTTNETINPNDDLKIPEWINQEYFEPIVAADVPEFQQIIKLTPVAATAPGENYTSIMVRVIMELEMKDGSQIQKSYILKTELSYANESTKFLNAMCLFPKELLMYKDILPQLVTLYKEAGVEVQLAPKCLHVEQTPEKMTLVMEDLSQYGFANVDRLKGFDMEHMTVVLEKLAELHAATARLHELNGPYEPMFNLSLYAESNREMFRMVDKSRRETTKKAMRQWGLENAEYFIEKMPTIDEVFDEGQLVNHVDPTEFNVLNHGDCWSNNIMFIHDKQSGEVKQTMFIDYQICKWGSPAQDLWYMITTSASLVIKVKDFDRFIYIYHKRLVECLKLLKYGKKLPTLKEIHIMMIKYGQWGPLTANGVMTAVLLPTDKDASMENLLKDGPEAEGFKIRSLTNPYYAKAMCQLYPFFDRKGLLDYST